MGRPNEGGTSIHVEQVTDVVAYHGKGPAWSPRWGGLRWVDMLAGDVLSSPEPPTSKRQRAL